MTWLNKIGLTTERGRRVLLFLFCLFLAFLVWVVHRLSDDYSAYLSYKLTVLTNIEGRVPDAISKEALVLRAKSKGFYILRQRLGIDPEEISIDLESRLFKKRSGSDDGFYLLSASIKEFLMQYLGDNIEVESVMTDTLNFEFARQTNVKVPVAINKELSFKSQYMQSGVIRISPDTIILYGDVSRISQIDSVKTCVIRYSDLQESRQGMVPLEKIDGVRFSQNEIYYYIGVERYIESVGAVSLRVINAPHDKLLSMFPYKVSVRYREALFSKEHIDLEKQSIVVDYNDLSKSLNNLVKPKWIDLPEQILYYDIDPPFVECFVINKQF